MNNRRWSHPFTWVNFAAFRFAVPVVIGASSISRFETDCPTTVTLRTFSTRS